MIGKQVLATLLATLWAVAPTGRVQEVRISPSGDETEIAVITNGDVEVRVAGAQLVGQERNLGFGPRADERDSVRSVLVRRQRRLVAPGPVV